MFFLYAARLRTIIQLTRRSYLTQMKYGQFVACACVFLCAALLLRNHASFVLVCVPIVRF